MYLKEISNIRDQVYVKLSGQFGSVFNHPDWIELFGNKIEVIGIYNNNHELIGSFNLFHFHKLIFTVTICPPFNPHCGLWFNNPAQSPVGKMDFEKDITALITDFLIQKKSSMKLVAFPYSLVDFQNFFWKGFKVIPNYTYRLDLTNDLTTIYENFSSEKRKSINRAEKDSVTIYQNPDKEIVYRLILSTFSRKEKQLNKELLRKIVFDFANQTNSFSYVADFNGKPSACVFVLHDQHTAYYMFGGYANENKHHGAGVTCMWNAIQHAKQIGLRVFDFEGSMLKEVERYFREFGGTLTPYFVVHRANFLMECVLKFKSRNRF